MGVRLCINQYLSFRWIHTMETQWLLWLEKIALQLQQIQDSQQNWWQLMEISNVSFKLMICVLWEFQVLELMFRLCKWLKSVFLNFSFVCSNSLMKFRMNMYKLKEGKEMKASTYSKLVSTTMYEKR